MEIDADPDYLAYLQRFYLHGKTHRNKAADKGVKYGEIKPTRTQENNKPKRKRIGHDLGSNEVVIKESGGERARLELDSARLRKQKKETNEEGLKGKELVPRTYDLDYFNFLSHLKVVETGIAVEIGGEVVVNYEEEVDAATVHDSSMEKDGFLEEEAGGKSKNRGALLEGGGEGGEIGQIGTSFEKSGCQSENESVVAQVLGFAEVSDDNTDDARHKADQNEEIEVDCRQTSEALNSQESGGERAWDSSARLRKQRKDNKEEGLKGKELVPRTYDFDYFNYLRHMKVLKTGIAVKIGDEVVVNYEGQVDTTTPVPELERQNSRFEEGRKNALLEGGEEDEEVGKTGTSCKKLAVKSETESVIAQVVGFAEVSENTNNGRQKTNQNEEIEIDCGDASHKPEAVNPDSQGFMLLVKKLCPVGTTIYPGFTGNENATGTMDEPCTRTNIEKKPNQDVERATNRSSPRGFFDFDWIEDKGEEEVPKAKMKRRRKGNGSSCKDLEVLEAFLDLPDSDEEPQIDEIPEKILRRPPSDYKDKLIEVLRRPFDKSEYRTLMNEITLRKKRVIYKELRSGGKAVETDEESKSYFDFYPEFKIQVESARYSRRLTLLRGFFFWLENCCWKGSFKPWERGHGRDKVHSNLSNSDS